MLKWTVAKRLTDEERRKWLSREKRGRPPGIRTRPCSHPGCTGIHNGRKPYATWCPAMKERKRARDLAWYDRTYSSLRGLNRRVKQHLCRGKSAKRRIEERIRQIDEEWKRGLAA